MTDFRQQAEIVKLARLLYATPEALSYLKALDADVLHDLRQSVSHLLLDQHRARFARIASASKLLPMPLLSFISERVLGPLLCARVASEMNTARAIEICKHLSIDFMASTVIYLEVERACELTMALPLHSVIAVTHELVRRQEFITMGALVGALPMPIIDAVLREVNDGEALLRGGFFVESPARLNAILDTLPMNRLQAIIAAAADETMDLWPHALALMSVVAPHWQARLVNIAADSQNSTLESMIHGVAKHDLWSAVLPLIGLMTHDHQTRVINLPVLNDDDVLRRLLATVDKQNLWQYLLPLIPLMNDGLRQRIAALADEFSEATLRHLTQEFCDRNLWGHALLLVEKMSSARRAAVAELVAERDDDALARLIDSINERQQWQLVLPLVAAMTPGAQERFMRLPRLHDENLLHAMVETVSHDNLWPLMLPLVGLMDDAGRRRLVQITESLDAEALRRWTNAICEPAIWPITAQMLGCMCPLHRSTIFMFMSEQNAGGLHRLLLTLDQRGQWALFIQLMQGLSNDAQRALIRNTCTLDIELRVRLMQAADAEGSDIIDVFLLSLSEIAPASNSSLQEIINRLDKTERDHLQQRCHGLGLTMASAG